MRFRKLRIAWSVGCGIVAVLMIVLWVRSYFQQAVIRIRMPGYRFIESMSFRGWSSFVYDSEAPNEFNDLREFPRSEMDFIAVSARKLNLAPGRGWRWGSYGDNSLRVIQTVVPCWFTTFVAGTFATLPWIRHLRWRFTLRTLLIATTMVAVVLGLIVWLR